MYVHNILLKYPNYLFNKLWNKLGDFLADSSWNDITLLLRNFPCNWIDASEIFEV